VTRNFFALHTLMDQESTYDQVMCEGPCSSHPLRCGTRDPRLPRITILSISPNPRTWLNRSALCSRSVEHVFLASGRSGWCRRQPHKGGCPKQMGSATRRRAWIFDRH